MSLIARVIACVVASVVACGCEYTYAYHHVLARKVHLCSMLTRVLMLWRGAVHARKANGVAL